MRAERESDSRRREVADLIVPPRPAERAGWRRLQRKNLNILGLLRRKERSQCHRESSWNVRQSRFCQKEKEQSRQYKVPDREGGVNQSERQPHPGERAGDQSENMERKGWTPR